MATLYISEYAHVDAEDGGAQVAIEPRIAVQTVAIAGSSAASSAFDPLTYYVRIHTDAICSYKFGRTAPTAVAS